MIKKKYTVTVNAPASKVYNTMLGLNSIKDYEAWTAEFNPTSTYEGNWNKGSKMYFVGTGEDGKGGGMISHIAEHTPNQFVSIKHIGMLNGDTEILSGPDVEKWTGGHENYTFNESNGSTTLTVDIDVIPEYEEYFDGTYPKALEKLKENIEKH